METQVLNSHLKNEIAPFWIRTAAIILDFALLAVLGFLLTLIFEKQFVEMKTMGRIFIGLPIYLLYFGLLDSELFKGQTIGKRLLRIKVIQENESFLTLKQSFLRTFIFILPIILNGTFFPYKWMESFFIPSLFIFILVSFNINGLYLYLFNRRNRKTLHDLFVNSLVVKENSPKVNFYQAIWKGHIIFISAVFAITATLSIVFTNKMKNIELDKNSETFSSINKKLMEIPAITSSTAMSGVDIYTDLKTNVTTRNKFVNFDILTLDKLTQFDELEAEIVKSICTGFPNILDYQIIKISFKYQVSIGIWGTSKTVNRSFSPVKC